MPKTVFSRSDITTGKTYTNGGSRRRTVIAMDALMVYYKTPTDYKRCTHAGLIWSEFLKWAKAEEAKSC